VHAKDLADDNHNRKPRLAFWLGAIGRHLEIAHGHRHLASRQPVEIGMDRLRRHRQHRRRKGRAQCRLHEAATVKAAAGYQALHFCIKLHRTLLAPTGGYGERNG